MLKLLEKLFGETNEVKLNLVKPLITKINNLEHEYSNLTDDELKSKTPYFKNLIENRLKDIDNNPLVSEDTPKIPGIIRTTRDKATYEVLEQILPETFALVREASKRTLNMRHFDVQLIGGIILHQGKIAEMRTGEGKTLVATLPV